jgi:hypothetical protein
MKALLFPLKMIAALLRLLGRLQRIWPLLALTAFILSPIGPHLLWTYEYRNIYGNRIITNCQYLGSHGVIAPAMKDDSCPVIAWLDAREWR